MALLVLLSLVRQGVDAGPQDRQRLVDLTAFLEPLSLGFGLLLSLAASQVDEVESGAEEVLNVFVAFAALKRDCENRVGPRRVNVHLGLGHSSSFLSCLKNHKSFLIALDYFFLDPVYKDSVFEVFSQIELLVGVSQQVVYFLVVDFHVGHFDQVLVVSFLKQVEEILNASRLNSFQLVNQQVALHRVGLPCPGLSVDEQRAVVALQKLLHHFLTRFLKNVFLGLLLVKDTVVGETLVLLLAVVEDDAVLVDLKAGLLIDQVLTQRRLDSHTDLDVFAHVVFAVSMHLFLL